LFQGLEFTEVTRLFYARHRDYSAVLGRFIERDPIGFAAGDNNWYRFVGNGPTGKTDPSGLSAWDNTVDVAAGFSDVATLGIAPSVRWWFEWDLGINRSNPWYWGGAAAPVVVVGGAVAIPAAASAIGASSTGVYVAAGEIAIHPLAVPVAVGIAEAAGGIEGPGLSGVGGLADDVARCGAQAMRRCAAQNSVLAGKTLKELTRITRGLPWNKLWKEGAENAAIALVRLRSGEKIVPDGLGREALEAYGEIARRALADPTKATEVQRLRLQIIEELLKGRGEQRL
jgi:RHS repeat-associated protein